MVMNKKIIKVWTKNGTQELTEDKWTMFEFDFALLHREDGPAAEHASGIREWWVNGKRHRLDGPAIEIPNVKKEWWVEDKLHREDGPAIEYYDGTKKWCINGELHRIDGPAIERATGAKEWFINKKRLNTEEVEKWLEENTIDLATESGQMAFKLMWM